MKSVKNLKETVSIVAKLREEEFGIKDPDENFKDKLYQLIKQDIVKKEVFIEKLFTNEFSLAFEKSKDYKNVFFVKLEHNVYMPMVYSSRAIDKVYNSSIIFENRLKIEYILLSSIIMRDAIKGEKQDIYIAEFSVELFDKISKLNNVLDVMEHQLLQASICLNVNLYNYKKYYSKIVEYIRKGFCFSITLDNSLKDISTLEELRLFKFIVYNKQNRLYKEIKNSKTKYKNLIEQ